MYVRIMHQGERRQGAAASGTGGVPAAGPGGAAMSFADRLAVVDAAASASLAGVVEVLRQCLGPDLGVAFAELDDLVRRARAAQVAVLGEAVERGEVASSDQASATAWVLAHGSSFRDGGA